MADRNKKKIAGSAAAQLPPTTDGKQGEMVRESWQVAYQPSFLARRRRSPRRSPRLSKITAKPLPTVGRHVQLSMVATTPEAMDDVYREMLILQRAHAKTWDLSMSHAETRVRIADSAAPCTASTCTLLLHALSELIQVVEENIDRWFTEAYRIGAGDEHSVVTVLGAKVTTPPAQTVVHAWIRSSVLATPPPDGTDLQCVTLQLQDFVDDPVVTVWYDTKRLFMGPPPIKAAIVAAMYELLYQKWSAFKPNCCPSKGLHVVLLDSSASRSLV